MTYTGTFIEELIQAVAREERRAVGEQRESMELTEPLDFFVLAASTPQQPALCGAA
jgi:hypothetical protein